MGDLSEHFDRREFACKCGNVECDAVQPRGRLVETLEAMRRRLGRRILISSGVRCHAHDIAQAKTEEEREQKRREPGEHVTGEAADVVAVGSRDRYQIIEAATAVVVRRIGVGRDFVHIGVSDTRDQDVVWLY